MYQEGKVGGIYPFDLMVGLGHIPRVSYEYKYGYNPELALSTEEDIWDFGGAYIWSTTAAIDSVSSSSGLDTQTILVKGLDENWNLANQTVTLQGQTRVPLGTPLIRAYRVINLGTSSFAGGVYIYENTALSGGVPVDTTKIRAYVDDGNNQTLMTQWTVPTGYTAFVQRINISLGGRIAGFCTFKMWARPYGGVFTLKGILDLDSDGTSIHSSEFKVPLIFPEKTDFKGTATGSALGLTAGMSGDFYLIKNEE